MPLDHHHHHYSTACLCCSQVPPCGSVSLFPSSVLAYTVVITLSAFCFYFTPCILMKSALFTVVPLRCLLTNCGPSYLLFTCFLIVCYCYGVVRAVFFAMESRVEKVFDDDHGTVAGMPSL